VKTGAVPIAAVSHLTPLLVTVVAVSMSAAATERGVRPLKMVGSARPLPDDKSRGAGDDHPAPRAAWEEEGVEAGGGACRRARRRSRRD